MTDIQGIENFKYELLYQIKIHEHISRLNDLLIFFDLINFARSILSVLKNFKV